MISLKQSGPFMTTALFAAMIFLAALAGCSHSAKTPDEPLEPGQECRAGETREGFLSPTASGSFECQKETQTCTNGQWPGRPLHAACENYTSSCDGTPHGMSVTGYGSATSEGGMPCMPATKTCLDGQWVGEEVFDFCNDVGGDE